MSFVEGDANYSNNDCSNCVVKFAGVLNRISINHALLGQRLKPFRDSVSSFGENVDASLSNSVVTEDKQAAFVSLVIQYYFNSTIFLVLMYYPA